MRAVLVSHTHWDREWYRTHQAFRSRLVDAIDRLLDLCRDDPGYRFLLDGQVIALLDYAEIRPGRVAELRERIAAGQIAIGPWLVQPDSLLPSGEAHVRNLLLGRRLGAAFGPVSRIAYTPDSFGHPAQFPQLFAGFGMRSFIYWRGHGGEVDALPSEWDWVAPDGTALLACHLGKGYFNAASDPRDAPNDIAGVVAERVKPLVERTRAGALLLMNGVDHAAPEARTAELAKALEAALGVPVERGHLEDFTSLVEEAPGPRPSFAGELVGARTAPLLPGVWSTRSWIKLASRACETELEGWAEPFAALAARLGAPDERPALRLAWRELLANQAHDSICGCSRDEVHEQMRGRFDAALELARETGERAMAALAGRPDRRSPWSDEWDVAVFNPSPHVRTDVVRIALDPHPWMAPTARPQDSIHPLLLLDPAEASFTADGLPARVVPAAQGRLTLLADRPALDLEIVARDVPALGWTRVRLRRSETPLRDEVREVEAGGDAAAIALEDRSVAVRADGTLDVRIGNETWDGLLGVEDLGDRGDSYDFDPVGTNAAETRSVTVRRIAHPGGLQRLEIDRTLSLPARLEKDRATRSGERVDLQLRSAIELHPSVPRVDVEIEVEDPAEDHRLRLLFPLGRPVETFDAATTFDVARRTPGARPDDGWVQRAPATFPHQGFVCAGGLSVVAPGLAEAEVVSEERAAALAITLLRCVGNLSRHDLQTRPGPAGPGTATPGAQCPGRLRARLSLFTGLDPRAARDAELGLRAVACGDAPLLPPDTALLELTTDHALLSALKPAEDGEGLIARVLNPGDTPCAAELRLGFEVAGVAAVRLDEQPLTDPADLVTSAAATPVSAALTVPAHGLRSLRID